MANLNMDLTGTLANYAVSDRLFRIFKYEQYVDLEATVFSESLHVYLISGAVTTELVRDEDYLVPAEAIAACDNDMSYAKLMDPNFDKELCAGIQLIRPIDGGAYTISVAYQRLYPNQLRTAYYHNEPFGVTPELLLDVVKSIDELRVYTTKVTDVGALTTGDSLLLEVDESKTNPNNEILNEEHTVNVGSRKFIIHPKGGSFYYDSVTVYYPAANETLVLGKDYFITGMDEARTKATSHTSPVYKFIEIVSPINGTVQVSYWAYGGDPTLDNYRSLLNNMNNVIQYLNESQALTAGNLGSTEIITALYERVDTLEDRMRRLEGTPAYGDITDGKCILMKLFADTPGLHWYTIASLYTTTGVSVKPCTADTFTFRLQGQLSHIQFTAAVSVDLNNKSGDILNINMIADNYPRGYQPFVDYSEIDGIIRPQLRIVWAEGDTVSGAYLQLGFQLNGMVEETICVEDMSGHESCWKLVDESASVTGPQDSDFLLPDGISTWSDYSSSSKSESMLVPFTKGHLLWAGTQPMNRPAAGWQMMELTDELLLAEAADIRKFKRLRFDIEEKSGLQFPIDVVLNSGTEHLSGHASFTHQQQPVYINAELYYNNDDVLTLRVNYDVSAGTESNELDIRDIVVYL